MQIEIGNISQTYGNIIVWDIPTFSLLPQKSGRRILSPEFSYCYLQPCSLSSNWNIEVPEGSIGLILSSKDFKPPPNKYIRFGIADDKNNDISLFSNGEWIEKHGCFKNGYFRVQKLVTEKCLLWSRQPSTEIRIKISCKVNNKRLYPILKTLSQEDNIRAETFDMQMAVSSKESEDNVLKNDDCTSEENNSEDSKKTIAHRKAEADEGSDDTIFKNCNSVLDEDQDQDVKNLGILRQNLKDLYVGGKFSDVTFKVKEREFKVHKAILAARSSVFDGMFTHGLTESNTGIVPIEDCEPAVFEEFLYFVYTGRTQSLSSENVCELYYVADKYFIEELKSECIHFLKKSLSIDLVCDVICLSIKCNETELLDLAIKFFARNFEAILVTVKWQLFLKENPIEANELTIKAVKLGFTKREV